MLNIKRTKKFINKYWTALAVSLLFFLFSNAAEAATLNLSPSSGSFPLGSTITVTVSTNTRGASVNSAEANITFTSDTLDLIRTAQGSTFYLPAPGSPSSGPGTAYFGGGLPNPGYTGSGGSVGILTFRAKALGTARVSISGGKVLLNDGFGTNALTSSGSATFTIVQPPPSPVGAPQVSSSTHPNPEVWYSGKKVELFWSRPNEAFGFSFELDRNEETAPDNTLDTTVTTTQTYENLDDGVWYFHIKARSQSGGFGNTVHFPIKIDSTPPKPFEMRIEGEAADLKAVFGTEDELSGIDRYDLYVSDELYEENIQSPFSLSELGGGRHNIKIAAFDKAGNKTEVFGAVYIEKSNISDFLTRMINVPLYVILLFLLLLLITILLLITSFIHRGTRTSQSVYDLSDVEEELGKSMDALRKNISKKLASLEQDSTEELKEKEKMLDQEISEGIGKAIDKIETKIKRSGRPGRKK